MIKRYEGDKSIFRFADFVNESKEDRVVTPRPLNVMEKYYVKMLTDFLEIVYEYVGPRGYEKHTEAQYKEFVDRLTPFKNMPFAKEIMNYIKGIDSKLTDRDVAKSAGDANSKEAFRLADEITSLLTKGDLEAAYKLNDRLRSALDSISKASISTGETVSMPNLYKKTSSMFGEDEFLPSFGPEELKTLSETDYSKELYTYLSFPKKMLDDFKYLAYFAINLKDSPKPVRLSGSSFRKWHEMLHIGEEKYAKLIVMVQKYLYNNDKESIPEILDTMKKFPELVEANNKRKKSIKVVYRGLGFHYDDDDAHVLTSREVVERDKKTGIVATSQSKYAARNFEYMKGHLDAGRNSDYGFMIEYDVTPESIVLDTSIFGGAFGDVESEVLIDASKANVRSVKKSRKYDEREAA